MCQKLQLCSDRGADQCYALCSRKAIGAVKCTGMGNQLTELDVWKVHVTEGVNSLWHQLHFNLQKSCRYSYHRKSPQLLQLVCATQRPPPHPFKSCDRWLCSTGGVIRPGKFQRYIPWSLSSTWPLRFCATVRSSGISGKNSDMSAIAHTNFNTGSTFNGPNYLVHLRKHLNPLGKVGLWLHLWFVKET